MANLGPDTHRAGHCMFEKFTFDCNVNAFTVVQTARMQVALYHELIDVVPLTQILDKLA